MALQPPKWERANSVGDDIHRFFAGLHCGVAVVLDLRRLGDFTGIGLVWLCGSCAGFGGVGYKVYRLLHIIEMRYVEISEHESFKVRQIIVRTDEVIRLGDHSCKKHFCVCTLCF